MRVLLAAAGEDGAVAPTLVKRGEEETPAHPASVERLACQLFLFVIFEQIAETRDNPLPAGSEFAPREFFGLVVQRLRRRMAPAFSLPSAALELPD